nr:hypothetical protein [Verrucomicrobiales bacterium]
EIRAAAMERMQEKIGEEAERLIRLQEMQHPVRQDEIAMLQAAQVELKKYLTDTPLRVDSVRLILAMA